MASSSEDPKDIEDVVFGAACDYVSAGLSLLPVFPDGNKEPAPDLLPFFQPDTDAPWRRGWFPLMHRLPTLDELESWYLGWVVPNGIGVICGATSGNLEAIDIDSTSLVQPWMQEVRRADPGLFARLVMVQTPRPGLHVYYRCPTIEKNQKLAVNVTVENDKVSRKTLIETRGEGGYALVPPSPAECHPTKRLYQYASPLTLVDVATISVAERTLLIEVSQSFDLRPQRRAVNERPKSAQQQPTGTRPGDIFNARADWVELLVRHGWTWVTDGSDGVSFWRRPGKPSGTSATLNYENSDRLFVFSSNADPLEEGRSYSKFEFVTLMEHDGDFQAAASALSDAGFVLQEPLMGRKRGGRSRLARQYQYQDRGAKYRKTTRRC